MTSIEELRRMAATAAAVGDFDTANELEDEALVVEEEDLFIDAHVANDNDGEAAHYDALADAAELERLSKVCGGPVT